MTEEKDSGERYIQVGTSLVEKSEELQRLGKDLPRYVRIFKGYGELFVYFGNEIKRAGEAGVEIDDSMIFGSTLDDVMKTLTWTVPSTEAVSATMAAASDATVGTMSIAVSAADGSTIESSFLQDPPESYWAVCETKAMVIRLNELKQGLGTTWENAWDALATIRPDSAKNASVNARTVVDELSWMTPYDYLKTLQWHRLDNKGNPTRATRFAWIHYGDNLPHSLDGKPYNDDIWKSLKRSYNDLQKYVHCSETSQMEAKIIETNLKAIGVSLEEYLEAGFDRLKESKTSS